MAPKERSQDREVLKSRKRAAPSDSLSRETKRAYTTASASRLNRLDPNAVGAEYYGLRPTNNNPRPSVFAAPNAPAPQPSPRSDGADHSESGYAKPPSQRALSMLSVPSNVSSLSGPTHPELVERIARERLNMLSEQAAASLPFASRPSQRTLSTSSGSSNGSIPARMPSWPAAQQEKTVHDLEASGPSIKPQFGKARRSINPLDDSSEDEFENTSADSLDDDDDDDDDEGAVPASPESSGNEGSDDDRAQAGAQNGFVVKSDGHTRTPEKQYAAIHSTGTRPYNQYAGKSLIALLSGCLTLPMLIAAFVV